MVLVNGLLGCGTVTELYCDPRNLVFKDVRQALEEYQGQDVVLEFGRVERPANLACGLPEPLFEAETVRPVRAQPGKDGLTLEEDPSLRRGYRLREVLVSVPPIRHGALVDSCQTGDVREAHQVIFRHGRDGSRILSRRQGVN